MHLPDNRLLLLLLWMVACPAPAQAAIRMAITIDDLPLRSRDTHDMTPQAVVDGTIAVLKKHRVPGVYGFINASHLETEPALKTQLQHWRQAGYLLGNHTYSHLDFAHTTPDIFMQDIIRNEPVLRAFAGASDWHYVRFPYLSYGAPQSREALFASLKQHGYTVAYVSLDFQDWQWIDPYLRCKGRGMPQSIQSMKQLYMDNARDALERTEAISHALFTRDVPYIMLLHVSEFNLQVLDALLAMYEAQGVTFITLQEALADPVYQQFGMVADRIDRGYDSMDVWQSWRGPLALPGLTLEVYDEKPAEKLKEICTAQPRN